MPTCCKCDGCKCGDLAAAGFPASLSNSQAEMDGLVRTVVTVHKGTAVGPSTSTAMDPDAGRTIWTVPGPGLHLNSATVLPPVDCPLLIKIPAGTEFSFGPDTKQVTLEFAVLLKVERRSWVTSKSATPTYCIEECGNEITGKFEWTYP